MKNKIIRKIIVILIVIFIFLFLTPITASKELPNDYNISIEK
jgi:polyferredoxin